jgi:hypothetical protein
MASNDFHYEYRVYCGCSEWSDFNGFWYQKAFRERFYLFTIKRIGELRVIEEIKARCSRFDRRDHRVHSLRQSHIPQRFTKATFPVQCSRRRRVFRLTAERTFYISGANKNSIRLFFLPELHNRLYSNGSKVMIRLRSHEKIIEDFIFRIPLLHKVCVATRRLLSSRVLVEQAWSELVNK